MAYVGNVHQLLILRILQGAMTGFSTASFTLAAASVPRDQTGFAMGLLQLVVYVGAALGPALGGIIADTVGYRGCFLLTGILMGLGGLLVALLVRESRSGLVARDSSSVRESMQVVLGSSAIVGLLAVRSLVSSGTRTINAMLPLFIQSLEPTQSRIASIVGVLNSANLAATAVGAVVAGRVADWLGARMVLKISLVVGAMSYLLQAGTGSVAQLLVLQAVTGAAIGATLSTLSAALAELAPEGRQGAVFGLQISFVQAANAIGPMLGAAIAASHGLRGPFLLAGAACMVSAGLAFRLRPT
jgi:DHA1 family multidrug resistance protein-like MFS transporter